MRFYFEVNILSTICVFLVSATEIHGLDACTYYASDNPINTTFVGKKFEFEKSQELYNGVLTSPNYPYAYNSKMYCSWKFVLTPDQSIRLNVTDLVMDT